MEKLSGIITSEIKSISYSPILFRFTLTDMQDQHYNMLIHTHALNFFQQAKMGSAIEVWAVKIIAINTSSDVLTSLIRMS